MSSRWRATGRNGSIWECGSIRGIAQRAEYRSRVRLSSGMVVLSNQPEKTAVLTTPTVNRLQTSGKREHRGRASGRKTGTLVRKVSPCGAPSSSDGQRNGRRNFGPNGTTVAPSVTRRDDGGT